MKPFYYFLIGLGLMFCVGIASASTLSAVTWEQGVTFGGSAGTIRKGVTVFSPLGDALIAGEVRALGSKFAVSGTARLAAARMASVVGMGLRVANPYLLGATLLAYLAEGGINVENGQYVVTKQSNDIVPPGSVISGSYYQAASIYPYRYSKYGDVQNACDEMGGRYVAGDGLCWIGNQGFSRLYGPYDCKANPNSVCGSTPTCPPAQGDPHTELVYIEGPGGISNAMCALPSAPAAPTDEDWSKLPVPSQEVAAAYANEVADSDDILPIESNPVSVGGSDSKLIGNPYIKDGAWYADYAHSTVYPSGTSAVTTVEPVKVSDDITTVPDVAGTITNVDNSTSSSSSVTEAESVDYCLDNPDRAGCSTLDAPKDSDLDIDSRDFSITPADPFGAGAGTCPADKTLSLSAMGRSFSVSVSYAPICSFMASMRYVVIAGALLLALFIAFGFRQGGE